MTNICDGESVSLSPSSKSDSSESTSGRVDKSNFLEVDGSASDCSVVNIDDFDWSVVNIGDDFDWSVVNIGDNFDWSVVNIGDNFDWSAAAVTVDDEFLRFLLFSLK